MKILLALRAIFCELVQSTSSVAGRVIFFCFRLVLTNFLAVCFYRLAQLRALAVWLLCPFFVTEQRKGERKSARTFPPGPPHLPPFCDKRRDFLFCKDPPSWAQKRTPKMGQQAGCPCKSIFVERMGKVYITILTLWRRWAGGTESICGANGCRAERGEPHFSR